MFESDAALRAAFIIMVLICAAIVTLVLLTPTFSFSAPLVAWFYFATVDYEQVWTFGPFSSFTKCMEHRADTVPHTVEATMCSMMSVAEEEA